MSDIVVNDPAVDGAPADTNEFFLDGDAPRLAAAPTIAAPPTERTPSATMATPTAATPSHPTLPSAPSLPVVSPVLSSPETPTLPDPTSGAAQADNPAETPTGGVAAEPEHPMAHLMPTRTMPNEASRRAAEKRAVHKAKSKKIKIGVISGMLIVTAVVGPPLGKWLVDAINEAGDTSTVEEPAE